MNRLSNLIGNEMLLRTGAPIDDNGEPHPDLMHKLPAEERVAFFGRLTGLQWLAKTVFPPLLQGIIGRWLLTKLFNKMVELGLIPDRFKQWLFHPVDNSIQAELNEGNSDAYSVSSEKDALYVLLANVQEADLDTAASICSGWSASAQEFSEEVVSDYAKNFFRSLRYLPKEDDIQACIDSWDASRSEQQIEAAVRGGVRGPLGVKKTPKGMNPECAGIWTDVLKNYEMQIKSLGAGDSIREWATAILIFQRVCAESKMAPWMAGVTPLGGSPSKDASSRKKLVNTLNKAVTRGMTQLKEMQDSLAGEPYNIVFKKAKKFGVFYNSTTDEYIGHASYLAQQVPKEALSAIRKQLTQRKNTLLITQAESYRLGLEIKGDEVYLQIQLPLRKDQAFLLVEMREHDNDSLLEALKKTFRAWSRNEMKFV